MTNADAVAEAADRAQELLADGHNPSMAPRVDQSADDFDATLLSLRDTLSARGVPVSSRLTGMLLELPLDATDEQIERVKADLTKLQAQWKADGIAVGARPGTV